MKRARRSAFNNFARGTAAGGVARRELKMGRDGEKVAEAAGIGTAIEYVRRTKAQKAAARKRQKQARRVNR